MRKVRKIGSRGEKLQKEGERGERDGEGGSEGVKEGKKQKENILFYFFLLTISGNETCQKADRMTKKTKGAKEDSNCERHKDDKKSES